MHFGRVADVLSASYAVNDSFSHLGAGMRSLCGSQPPHQTGPASTATNISGTPGQNPTPDTCHTIPGVMTATATVGPPLTQIRRRSYRAGRIENTPENMFEWIRHPRSVDDKTAMPDTGVTERDGRDIVAYLYTLR